MNFFHYLIDRAIQDFHHGGFAIESQGFLAYIMMGSTWKHILIATSTDIQFAVHSFARFSICPKQWHKDGVKYYSRIVMKMACCFILQRLKLSKYMQMLSSLIIGLMNMWSFYLQLQNPGQAGLFLLTDIQMEEFR